MRMARYAIPGALLLALAFFAVPASAQTEYSIWDLELGSGTTIPNGTVVKTDSVVVTGLTFNGFYAQEPDTSVAPAGTGWFNRSRREFSGIWVFTSVSPSTYGVTAIGDFVTVTGPTNEYFGWSEIDFTQAGSHAITYLGTRTPITPFPVKITEVNTASLTGENWENVLIRVDPRDPTLHATTHPFNSTWQVYNDVGPDTVAVTNQLGNQETPPVGAIVTFVQGAMRYHFNEFKIAPRGNADIGYVGPPNVAAVWSTGSTSMDVLMSRDVTQATAEDEFNYELLNSGGNIVLATRDATNHAKVHITTSAQTNGFAESMQVSGLTSDGSGGATMPAAQTFNFRAGITPISLIQTVANPAVQDSSPLVGTVVTGRGRVTSPSSINTNNQFFIQQGAGAWRGIYVSNQAFNAIRGDSIQISGRVAEYNGQTEVGYAGFDDFRVLASGLTPVATTVAIATMKYNNRATAEQYEGQLIKLQNGTVDSTLGGATYGEWSLIGAPGDTAAMDIITRGTTPNVTYKPCPGDVIDATGPVRYSYGDFRLLPRDNADIVIHSINPVCTVGVPDPIAGLPAPRLTQNFPNPFNPLTTIRFDVPSAMHVTLEVYNVAGARVRTLMANERMDRGSWVVPWDGTDDAGQGVPSGAYFARLKTAAGTSTQKMMLLK